MTTPKRLEVRLEPDRQLTLPAEIVRATGWLEGDRLVVSVQTGEPDTIYLQTVRETHAGSMAGVYGDTATYLEVERQSW